MKTLLARILCSAAHAMWQKEPTLGRYTRETAEHELNLAFHYAAELRDWFPWLDCDFDVTKLNFNRERPDIILHRRRSNLNFLVIEIKRERFRAAVSSDLNQIRDRWFQRGLRYRFGAAVILDEDKRGFEAQVLSREQHQEKPVILSQSSMGAPLQVPNCVRATVVVTDLEQEIDDLLHALYGPPPEEIKIVERAAKAP